MKKIAFTILLAVTAVMTSHAQGAYDAWLFSENNYVGTARSVAMGNAFTALGGDLGSIGINPAGSAVAGYSQISLTPSLTFAVNTAAGVPYEGSTNPYFQREMKNRTTKFYIPNVGATFSFDTGRRTGLKNVTIGIVMNTSNSWCEDLYANGTNSQTSFLAAVASDATDEIASFNTDRPSYEPEYTKGDYLNQDAFKYMNWRNTVAYRSGMISTFDAQGKEFVGATETLLENGSIMQSGKVDQTYGRTVSGSKYEYLINVGMNISDFVYVGANLGVNSIAYDYTHYFRESAVDPDHFENVFYDNDGNQHTTYFKEALYKHSYSADGTGVFGKVGVIVTPGHGIRIGAAVQTPTATTITEQWQDKANCTFTNSEFSGSADSDLGQNEYSFNSPWRGNIGLAYTLGRAAVFSVDYEIADFGSMKYKIKRNSMQEADVEYFLGVNQEIKETYGTSHHLRVGAEIKPIDRLALRAGYNMTSSAQKKFFDAYSGEYLDLSPSFGHNIALGAGFISRKSFFADIACRYTFTTDEYIYPYSDYILEQKGIFSPEILSRHSNWKLLMTVGWRF